jgi:hypothetical protein
MAQGTPNNKSVLSEYMGPQEPPAFDYEGSGDPYLISDEDPYLAKLEEQEAKGILDPAVPEVPVFKTLNLFQIRDLPDPEWLVSRYLQADSFAVLYGAPGSSKSFWALDIALSIATGIDFHGSEVKKGQVLMAAGEGLRGLKWRIEAWMLAHPEAEEADVLANLRIIPDVPHLLDERHSAMLLNTAEAMTEVQDADPLRLVIVDTWARAMVGGDENSQKDAGLAVNACERVRRLTGASVLVVHHSGTEGTRERGSTALRGAADTSLMMTLEESSRISNVIVKKMKDGESGHSALYTLKPFGHSVVLTPLGGGSTALGAPQPVVRDRDYYARKAAEVKGSAF